jgi:predicted amidohydrolase YtcJ
MDERGSTVEAILEEQGTIVASGTTEEMRRLARPGTREIDLQGMTVIPGLTDSHTHFVEFALGLSRADLSRAKSLKEALSLVETEARAVPRGGWVLGGGFNKNLWAGGRFPSRHDLDAVCADKPVVIKSGDCHTLWVNTLAMTIAGITRDTPVPEGGRIDLGPDGHPTGIIGESAIPLIEQHVPMPTEREIDDAVVRAQALAHSVGVTGVHVMEGAGSLRSFQRLQSRGDLSLRVCIYLPLEALEHARDLGTESGFGNEFVKVGGVKLFADGSLNSQTAHMLEPYEGTESRGISRISMEQLDEVVGGAVASGISVAVHAIGDAANRNCLNVLAKHAATSRAKGLRNRIEHAQLLHPDDIRRFAVTRTIASVQPVHATSDRYLADRLWGARARYAYPFRSLAAGGARVTFGSDAPVETINPMRGLFAAVTRKREDEPSSAPWYPEECVTLEQAVRAYTNGPAYAACAERRQGSLEPGKAADFVVLSEDIFRGPPETLLGCRVMMSVVGGRVVYES